MTAASLLAIGETYSGGLWPRGVPAPYLQFPFFALYAGGATLLLGAGISLFRIWERLGRPPRLVLQILVICGILALPIYAFHQLVVPVRDILVLLGMPGSVAMALPMGLFLLGMGRAGLHFHRIYFGRARERGSATIAPAGDPG